MATVDSVTTQRKVDEVTSHAAPPPAFLSKVKGDGLHEEYQELQEVLAGLAARGIEIPSRALENESALTHLSMAFRHVWRSITLGVGSALRCGQPTPKVSAAAGGDTDQVMKVDLDFDSLDGVPNAETLVAKGLIMPLGTWKEKWDISILMLILYSAVVVPVRVCFDADATGIMWLFEVTMTFCFILDMIFTFNQVYFDNATGQWVTSRKDIARNYLSGWFWIDFPSSIPIELVDIFLEDTGSLGLLRFLRMFRLLRLLRLLKIEEYIDTLENYFDTNLRILRVVFMLVRVALPAAHTTPAPDACIYLASSQSSRLLSPGCLRFARLLFAG